VVVRNIKSKKKEKRRKKNVDLRTIISEKWRRKNKKEGKNLDKATTLLKMLAC
jgi:thymidylate synthase